MSTNRKSKISAERVKWETMTRFNPLRNISPASLTSDMEAWERGEIGRLARVWDVMARRDLRLSGLMPKRVKAPARRDWNVVMLEDTPEARTQQELVEYALNHCELGSAVDGDKCEGINGLLRSMMTAVGMKYAVHELIWRPSEDGLTFTALEVPLWFFERRSGSLRFLEQREAVDGVDMERGEWMVTVADGLMESSGVAYMFKSLPLKDLLAFCDKFGVPGVLAKTDAPEGSKEWDAVHDVIAEFGSELAAVVSKSGTEIEFLETKGHTGTTPMENLVDYCDRAMASIWRGGDLSTMSRDNDAVGAMSQGKEASDLEADDCERLNDTVNRQIVHYVLKYALGVTRPLVRFEIDVSDLQKCGDEMAVDKGLFDMGFKHSVDDLATRYGRTPAQEGEDYLSKEGGVKEASAKKSALNRGVDNPGAVDERIEEDGDDLANVAGGDHWAQQGRDKTGRFGAMGMHSENTGPGMDSLKEVLGKVESDGQKAALQNAAAIDRAEGVESRQLDAIGDWAGTFEHSIYTEFEQIDAETLEYVMAKRGVKHGQAGTLAFLFDPDGEDLIFKADGFETIDAARSSLDEIGIENRTIVREAKSWSAVIYTDDREGDAKMISLSKQSGVTVQAHRGVAYQLGDWEHFDHSTGVRKQQAIVDRYEGKRKTQDTRKSRHPGRNGQGDGPGGSSIGDFPNEAYSRSKGGRDQGRRKPQRFSKIFRWLSNAKNEPDFNEKALQLVQTGIAFDFSEYAEAIIVALSEADPVLRKAQLKRIYDQLEEEGPPSSEGMEEYLSRSVTAAYLNGMASVGE